MNHSPHEMSLLLSPGIFSPPLYRRGGNRRPHLYPVAELWYEIRLMIFSFWVTSRLILLISFPLAVPLALFIASILDDAVKNQTTQTHFFATNCNPHWMSKNHSYKLALGCWQAGWPVTSSECGVPSFGTTSLWFPANFNSSVSMFLSFIGVSRYSCVLEVFRMSYPLGKHIT